MYKRQPLSPKGILIYGLVRQMGVTLLTGCFLVFQYGWLHTLYGISLGDLLLVLLCYACLLYTSFPTLNSPIICSTNVA